MKSMASGMAAPHQGKESSMHKYLPCKEDERVEGTGAMATGVNSGHVGAAARLFECR